MAWCCSTWLTTVFQLPPQLVNIIGLKMMELAVKQVNTETGCRLFTISAAAIWSSLLQPLELCRARLRQETENFLWKYRYIQKL